jgi:hypothetical protein
VHLPYRARDDCQRRIGQTRIYSSQPDRSIRRYVMLCDNDEAHTNLISCDDFLAAAQC